MVHQIQKIRSKNNKNWMDLLKLALNLDHETTSKILSEIYKDDQKISKTYFDSRVVMVQRGDPYADRPTNPEVYDQVAAQIEEQLKYPDRPIIKISDIKN